MIDPDGDAINLAHVTTVQAEMRSASDSWYACAFAPNGKGLVLSEDMATQAEVVAWIAKRFGGDFDQHADEAEALTIPTDVASAERARRAAGCPAWGPDSGYVHVSKLEVGSGNA